MVFIFLFLFFPISVFAAETADIYINELQIEPVQKVEIVNQGNSIFDVSGFYIDDDGGNTYYTIPEGTRIEPNSCIVIEGKFNLNKSSSDTVRLFDNTYPPTATLSGSIDSYTYNMSPGESVSFQRIPDGSRNWISAPSGLGSWNETKISCQILPSPLPTATSVPVLTPTPTPTETPPITNILISEAQVYPDSGGNEWIELYNPNNYDVDLLNWYIDDASDAGASPKKITILLPAKGYNVYELSAGIFNNGGDSVRLLNQSNIIVDSFSYLNAEKGLSVGRPDIQSKNLCHMEPTKGYENETCIEKPNPSQIPVPEIKTGISGFIPDEHNSTNNIALSMYSIAVTLPEKQSKNNPNILGTEDQHNISGKRQSNNSILTLSPLYSLLSIISLTAKMKLK